MQGYLASVNGFRLLEAGERGGGGDLVRWRRYAGLQDALFDGSDRQLKLCPSAKAPPKLLEEFLGAV